MSSFSKNQARSYGNFDHFSTTTNLISNQLWYFWDPHSKTFSVVPFLLGESCWKIGSFFYSTTTFSLNDELSWKINPGSVILILTPSIQGIICLCLVKFQKSHFRRLNCQFEFVSICMQDQSGLEIKDRDHFPICFNAMNLVVVLEFQNVLFLKSVFFKALLHYFTCNFGL